MQKALLFINGVPPEKLPPTDGYEVIACSDGAFHYLKEMNFPLEKLDFISGDFDSHRGSDEALYAEKFIYTPDQNKTDFQKSLEIISQKGIQKVDVYGGSGNEMDHFLGNLTVALKFKETLEIRFFDEFATYYFVPKTMILKNVKGRTISLFPFPEVKKITTKGLKWPLDNDELSLEGKIGTRNVAAEETVSIEYDSGNLVVFISHH